MAKKTVMGDVKEAVKSLAGAALGAAAAGAAGVVAETMKQMSEGDKKGGDTGPGHVGKGGGQVGRETNPHLFKKTTCLEEKEKGGKEEGYCRAARQKEKVGQAPEETLSRTDSTARWGKSPGFMLIKPSPSHTRRELAGDRRTPQAATCEAGQARHGWHRHGDNGGPALMPVAAELLQHSRPQHTIPPSA